jgi:hypothetical protein
MISNSGIGDDEPGKTGGHDAAAATVMLGKGIDHATFKALVVAGGIAAAGSGISLLRLL